MISVGTALMAADRMTIAKPVWIQIRMTISQKLLYGRLLDEDDRSAGLIVAVGSVWNPPTPPPMIPL